MLTMLNLASGMTGAFKAPEGFDLPAFWHNSFAVASTCKWLAKFSKDDAETAFTCGMMTVGIVKIICVSPLATDIAAGGEPLNGM